MKPRIIEDDMQQYADILRRLERLELGGASASFSGFSWQRSNSSGSVDTNIFQGGDITSDGTNRLEISVTPSRPVTWVVSWRALMDHSDPNWRRPDLAVQCSPADTGGFSSYCGIHGPGHHATAGDYAGMGGTVLFNLNPETTYTSFIRLTFDGGFAGWRYHRASTHTYIHGHTIPR